MLSTMLAACASLILVLAVPRAAKARRLARLFRRRRSGPRRWTARRNPIGNAPWRPRGAARAIQRMILSSHPPGAPPRPSCFLDSLTADAEPEMPDDMAPELTRHSEITSTCWCFAKWSPLALK